jgi:hypothetical protein
MKGKKTGGTVALMASKLRQKPVRYVAALCLLALLVGIAALPQETTTNAPKTSTVEAPKIQYMSQHEIAAVEQSSDNKPVFVPTGYDVLDIGASQGRGSVKFLEDAIKNSLKRKISYTPKTLGVDIDPNKVQTCKANGGDCMQGDVLKLQVKEGTSGVSGITMWHVLEHMPTCDLAKQIWIKSSSIGRYWTHFRGPSFDNANVLKDAGFHRFFENWSGHPCHFDSKMIVDAIQSSPVKPAAYIVANLKQVKNSESNVLLPNGSDRNSHHYDVSIHPPKPKSVTTFSDPEIYEEMRACAIYDTILKDDTILALDTALCLKDVLSALEKFGGTVVECHVGDSIQGDECRQMLHKQVANSIVKGKFGH